MFKKSPYEYKYYKNDENNGKELLYYGHSSIICDDKIILFGGISFPDNNINDDENRINLSNAVATIKINNDYGFQWCGKIITNGRAPAPRTGQTMCAIDNHRILIFGGIGESQKFNDLWICDLSIKKWEMVYYTGIAPTPRCEHSMCLYTTPDDEQKLFVFGGSVGKGSIKYDSNDLYCFSFKDHFWEQISCPYPKNLPEPRSGHIMIQTNNCLYMYLIFIINRSGGISNHTVYQDLYEYNIITNTWRIMSPPPKALWFHSACTVDRKV